MSEVNAQPRPRAKRRSSIIRMWTTLIIGYVLMVLVAGILQRRLIYFPTKLSEKVAEQFAAQNGFTPWRNATGEIIGWRLAANGTSLGSVLVTHGNAGCALDRDYFAQPIHNGLPLDVYILEYPGYGARGGAPGMSSILTAAEDAFDNLPKDKPVFLVSESLGAGVMAHLAKTRLDRVKGLVLFAPYDDLGAVGQASMPFLPVKLMMRDRFQPARWLEDYRGPVKIVLAGADEVIPTRFGQRLYDSYQGPKSLHLIPNARHNEVAEQSPDWWREVFAFWQQSRS